MSRVADIDSVFVRVGSSSELDIVRVCDLVSVSLIVTEPEMSRLTLGSVRDSVTVRVSLIDIDPDNERDTLHETEDDGVATNDAVAVTSLELDTEPEDVLSMVGDFVLLGAGRFVSDIEATSAELETLTLHDLDVVGVAV
jgi:hypothetical protein